MLPRLFVTLIALTCISACLLEPPATACDATAAAPLGAGTVVVSPLVALPPTVVAAPVVVQGGLVPLSVPTLVVPAQQACRLNSGGRLRRAQPRWRSFRLLIERTR